MTELDRSFQELERFERQRYYWIRSSILMALIGIFILLTWDHYGFTVFAIRVLLGIGSVVAIAWWTWTLFVIKKIINQRYIELQLFSEIITELSDIRYSITDVPSDLKDQVDRTNK